MQHLAVSRIPLPETVVSPLHILWVTFSPQYARISPQNHNLAEQTGHSWFLLGQKPRG